MIFDTDILIWAERGNLKAAELIDDQEEKFISVQTYMELLQGAKTQKQHTITRSFLHDFYFRILPFSENIGHRAAIYIEEYSLSHGLRAADAIIAATATESNLTLASSNGKHFKAIKDLNLLIFKP